MKVVATIYTSPPLDKYLFDRGDQYSPPIVVDVTGLSIDNTNALFLALSITNNAHNVQIPLTEEDGLRVKVGWTPSPAWFTHSQFFHLNRDDEL
jgi:hypothetical protein